MKKVIIGFFIIGVLLIGGGVGYYLFFSDSKDDGSKVEVQLTKEEQALGVLKKDYPNINFTFDKKTKDGKYQFVDATQTEYSKTVYTVDLDKKTYQIDSHTIMGTG